MPKILNNDSEKVSLIKAKQKYESYLVKGCGSAVLLGQWINEYKTNVYISSMLAIVGTLTCVVEQELYVVYGK